MLVDSHAHLDFAGFEEDRDEVIRRCADKNVTVINVGTQTPTNKLCVAMAQAHDHLYASVGLHPIHVFDEDFDSGFFETLITENDKVVAVGETGFDYFYIKDKEKSFAEIKAKQAAVFRQHITLAQKHTL
ncbi:MAG: TatD family hydrolase, partial [Candidatus Komeilibacteria bacterium]|nr:TatD family hydrolase [Candidatus Komeilibacteria bacterium]